MADSVETLRVDFEDPESRSWEQKKTREEESTGEILYEGWSEEVVENGCGTHESVESACSGNCVYRGLN